MAVEASDRLREEARLLRAEATAEVDRAKARAAQILSEARAERDRLALDAAVRYAVQPGNEAVEVRFGITWGIPLWHREAPHG